MIIKKIIYFNFFKEIFKKTPNFFLLHPFDHLTMSKIENQLKCGFQPSEFAFGEVVGSGSFGVVLKATYKNTNKEYAVKSITIQPNNKKKEKEKEIQSEISILEKINTTNPRPQTIPQYYGYFIETTTIKQENYIIIFDFFPTSLKGLLKTHIANKQPISFIKLKEIYQALLNGLSFLQSLNFCHRDISPHNLMIDSKGAIKIIDFGLSRDVEDLATMNQKQIDLTVAGKVSYMAPEVLEAPGLLIKTLLFLIKNYFN